MQHSNKTFYEISQETVALRKVVPKKKTLEDLK